MAGPIHYLVELFRHAGERLGRRCDGEIVLPPYMLLRRRRKVFCLCPRKEEKSEILDGKIYLWPHSLRWYFFSFASLLSIPLLVSGAYRVGLILFVAILVSQHVVYYWCGIPVLEKVREAIKSDEDILKWVDDSVFFDDTIRPLSRGLYLKREGNLPLWLLQRFLMMLRWIGHLFPPLDVRRYPLWWNPTRSQHESMLWFGIHELYQKADDEKPGDSFWQHPAVKRLLLFHCAPVWVSYLSLHLLLLFWYFRKNEFSPDWTQPFNFGPPVCILLILLWMLIAVVFFLREWPRLYWKKKRWGEMRWKGKGPLHLPVQLYHLFPELPRQFAPGYSNNFSKIFHLLYLVAIGIYVAVVALLWRPGLF